MEYEEYQIRCDTIRKDNTVLLEGFETWLREKGLGETTITKHLDSIDFYINHYLLYYDAVPAAEGADEVSLFLGNWFIRKAMWSSESSIRSYTATLKKFYQYICELGMIPQEELTDMKDCIKEELPEWLEALREYETGDFDF